MVAQGVLPYKLEEENHTTRMTGLAGLPIYLDLAHVAGLRDSIHKHVRIRSDSQGWSDAQILTALILLNLAGGESVEDLEKLEGDAGFAAILHRVETFGMSRRERRARERRWRKSTDRKIPSISAVRRYLAAFHDPEEEAGRVPERAFIPTSGPGLKGLSKVDEDLIAFLQRRRLKRKATLDMDATLIETHKKEALFCYKGHRAYQPLNVWWDEQQVIVHSEFRDGNVPAGFEQLRVLKESLDLLPEGVEEAAMRSDTAGYQWDLLRYCAEGRNERFGVIDFAVGADVTPAFRRAVHEVKPEDWKPLPRRLGDKLVESDQEWAEVCFVPQGCGSKKSRPIYRFLAIREPLPEQLDLPGVEESRQVELPFPTIHYKEEQGPQRYKLFGLVTNLLDLPGEQVIYWLRDRCGKSEEAHAVMKRDLAGGRLPSKLFGANAAWWGVMILTLNLHLLMKVLVLGEEWIPKRMKAVRYGIINLPGRLVQHARQLTLRLSAGHPANRLLIDARRRIADLARGSPPA